jgi:hypothetical protein
MSLFFFGACASGLGCAYLDASPRFSSSLNTLGAQLTLYFVCVLMVMRCVCLSVRTGNTIGAVAGLTSPLLVAVFIQVFPSDWSWKLIFLLTAFMSGEAAVMCLSLL